MKLRNLNILPSAFQKKAKNPDNIQQQQQQQPKANKISIKNKVLGFFKGTGPNKGGGIENQLNDSKTFVANNNNQGNKTSNQIVNNPNSPSLLLSSSSPLGRSNVVNDIKRTKKQQLMQKILDTINKKDINNIVLIERQVDEYLMAKKNLINDKFDAEDIQFLEKESKFVTALFNFQNIAQHKIQSTNLLAKMSCIKEDNLILSDVNTMKNKEIIENVSSPYDVRTSASSTRFSSSNSQFSPSNRALNERLNSGEYQTQEEYIFQGCVEDEKDNGDDKDEDEDEVYRETLYLKNYEVEAKDKELFEFKKIVNDKKSKLKIFGNNTNQYKYAFFEDSVLYITKPKDKKTLIIRRSIPITRINKIEYDEDKKEIYLIFYEDDLTKDTIEKSYRCDFYNEFFDELDNQLMVVNSTAKILEYSYKP